MKHILIAVAFVAAFFMSAAQAQSRNECLGYQQMVEKLSNLYGETAISGGLNNHGSLIQVFTSEQNDTWTIIVITPNKLACMVSAGKHWTHFKKEHDNEV